MLSKKVTITCLLVSTVTLLAAINAQSQTLASARILSSEGAVEIHRPSQAKGILTRITYAVNDELFAGDVIRTLKGGRLVLGLTDGSQAIIGEQTIIKIMDTSQSPRTIFNVLRGKTRVKIEKVGGRPNPYRVNTPTTVIAVRGTMFDVFVTDKETEVFVTEGEVAVSNIARPEAPVILSPGQKTRVEQSQPPEPPSRFQPGRNDDKFKSDQSGSGTGVRVTDQSGDSDRSRKPDQSPMDITTPDQKQPKQDPPPSGKPNSVRQPDADRKHERFFSDNG